MRCIICDNHLTPETAERQDKIEKELIRLRNALGDVVANSHLSGEDLAALAKSYLPIPSPSDTTTNQEKE